jgi:hypothetical protein
LARNRLLNFDTKTKNWLLKIDICLLFFNFVDSSGEVDAKTLKKQEDEVKKVEQAAKELGPPKGSVRSVMIFFLFLNAEDQIGSS